ncbi:MAG TPA: retroviral-like aspartic protease family protein [Sphingomicrobium sp.]|nr:retroviral-like aspartic protease family protein [Sphingomicrobium sp.]
MRRKLLPALSLALLPVAIAAGAAAQAPQIGKPRPAPPGPSTMPPLTPAEIDNALAIGGDDVDARKVETRLSVEVRVNGRGPYHFLVDSGADTSAVGLKIARELELPIGTPVILNNMTDRNIVDQVKIRELTLGPSTIRDLEVPALSEQHLGGAGLIGIDALVRQRLMMDFEERVIRVEDARQPVKSNPGDIVIVAKLQRGQLILTNVKAAGLSLDAVIDTGSQITIGNMALRDKLIRRDPRNVWTVSATGVTGKTVDLQMAQIRDLELGSITLQNVPVAFADLPPFKVFGIADQPALLIGTDLLENFRRVSLDFAARKVRFQLKSCRSVGIAVTTSYSSSVTRVSGRSPEACAP